MSCIISIILIVFFSFIKLSIQCDIQPTLRPYHPCSFIITSQIYHCQHVTVTSNVDQCFNEEMIFFWHYPLGNLTLILQSTMKEHFQVNLSKKFFVATKRTISNISHLSYDQQSEEQLRYNEKYGMIKLLSNENKQCIIKFQTNHSKIFDYGTFIRTVVVSSTDK